jgi:hypothetical protein
MADSQPTVSRDPSHAALQLGKYHITPLTKALDEGGFGCSVSIRSGSGSGTTDRVVRLPRRFHDRLAAAAYALEEGLRWISATPGLRTA